MRDDETDHLAARPAESLTAAPVTCAEKAQRAVVFHYHLFKNAGTSIDEVLRRNFGERWTAQEFALNRRGNATAIAEFIRNNPQLQAISSHTAFLPVPRIEGVEIFPIIFIRHPIDRLRSAYEFERRQNANTTGARLAKTHDFAGYLRELLRNPRHRQARSFQTYRLSHCEPADHGSEFERALLAINKLPFIGLVEEYDRSVERLRVLLQTIWPDFKIYKAHRNSSKRSSMNLEERIASIGQQIGHDLYAEICETNRDDLMLYSRLRDRPEIHHIASISP